MPKVFYRIVRSPFVQLIRPYLLTGYCLLSLLIIGSWIWAASRAVTVLTRASVVVIIGFVEGMFLTATGIAVLAIVLAPSQDGDDE